MQFAFEPDAGTSLSALEHAIRTNTAGGIGPFVKETHTIDTRPRANGVCDDRRKDATDKALRMVDAPRFLRTERGFQGRRKLDEIAKAIPSVDSGQTFQRNSETRTCQSICNWMRSVALLTRLTKQER